MPEKTASWRDAPTAHRVVERDTLPGMDALLLRDRLEALLSASATRPRISGAESEAGHLGSEDDVAERDTEPSVETRLLRDAFVAAGRSA